jgi:hypothetical protein
MNRPSLVPVDFMKKLNFRNDLIWLSALGIITLLIFGLLIGFDHWRTRWFEIQLPDAYIVLGSWQVWSLLFLNTTFWTYLIRQAESRFERHSSNIVLLSVTGLLIFITSLTIRYTGSMNQGWTIYPPLSSSSGKTLEKYIITPEINSFVQVYELFQISVFGFVGIWIGRGMEKRNAQQNSQPMTDSVNDLFN